MTKKTDFQILVSQTVLSPLISDLQWGVPAVLSIFCTSTDHCLQSLLLNEQKKFLKIPIENTYLSLILRDRTVRIADVNTLVHT